MESKLYTGRISSANLNEKRWLVIYTKPRWEKKVDKLLKQQGIESYCPLLSIENQWADRKKQVTVPLFTSYIFVRVSLREQFIVLCTVGVMGFVQYMARPAVVQDNIIDQIKASLSYYKNLEVISLQDISIGDRIKIKEGILVDKLGKVVEIQGKNVLVVLDNINCAIVTRIPYKNITIHN